jgi:hypothetical protein
MLHYLQRGWDRLDESARGLIGLELELGCPTPHRRGQFARPFRAGELIRLIGSRSRAAGGLLLQELSDGAARELLLWYNHFYFPFSISA